MRRTSALGWSVGDLEGEADGLDVGLAVVGPGVGIVDGWNIVLDM